MASLTRAWTRIDFERDGKQVGTFNFNHSIHRSAYGVLRVPMAVIRNGRGPTVLLMAGNHGDEYEGQVALAKLVRTLDPGRVRGRLIVLPMANAPAALAGTRTSPIDGGNLNRVFPGDPGGTPTQQIAYYIGEELMPMTDAFVDLHSGGSSLEYVPSTLTQIRGEPDYDARAVAAARAFGYPYCLAFRVGVPGGQATDSAYKHRILNLGGEFGGQGVVTPGFVRRLEDGLARLLDHLGVVPSDRPLPPPEPVRFLESGPPGANVYAAMPGIMEPVAELGSRVEPGDVACLVHAPEHPDREPVPYRFEEPGLLISRRAMGRVEPGDCLAEVWVDSAVEPTGA
jgi:hypothetical protein